MTEKWMKVELAAPPSALLDVTNTIKKITSAISTILTIQKTMLEIVSAFIFDFIDAESLLIKTAIAALESVLNTFYLKDAKIHVLVVPLSKRPPTSLRLFGTMPQPDTDAWTISDSLTDEEQRKFQEAMEIVGSIDQGNEGFARTVIESLHDTYDVNRPNYGPEAAFYAQVILVGAKDFLKAIEILKTLQALFSTGLKKNRMVPDNLARGPQDLRVTVVPSTNSPRIATLLEWKNPPALQILPEFGGIYVRLDEIAVIRSTNDQAIKATDWNSFFTAQPAALGEKEPEKTDVLQSLDKESTVIRQLKFFPALDSTVDKNETLKKNINYYYAVAFRYSIAAQPGPDGKLNYVLQDYFKISNVVKIRQTDQIPSSYKGPQPDWFTHPSVLDLIPDLKFYLGLLAAYIHSLGSRLTGSKTALETYIKFLEAEAKRYEEFGNKLANLALRLMRLFQLPSTGIYGTTILSDKGGTAAFMRELARRLTDQTDTSAPPFFGTGATAGLIFFAGASNPAQLQPVKTLLSLLFGGAAASPFENAIKSIDNLLKTAEEKLFDSTMQPSTETPTTLDVLTTFDKGMKPTSATDMNTYVAFDP